MKRVFVSGYGAVSPAGWGVAALREALAAGAPLPIQPLPRPGWEKALRARLVPNPSARPPFLAHPRLRRSSPITHYAAAAALEALANSDRGPDAPIRRLGLIMCLQAGCVHYSYRFLAEALADPATASPLVFPETVFAAPASHLAAMIGHAPLVYTLIGDPATFLQGVAIGAAWLLEGRVDSCLIIGAEEVNWLRADALWHLEHAAVISGGAGAVCLSTQPFSRPAVELACVTEPQTYSSRKNRTDAARAMRQALGKPLPGELLCDGLGDSPRTDAPETAAWQDWRGPRVSPKRLLGEGLMASAAWQAVVACDQLNRGLCPAATISVVGCNQQAVAARFARVN